MHEKYHLAKKKSPFPCNNVEQSLPAIVGWAFLKEKGNLYFLLLIVSNYFAQGQVCIPDQTSPDLAWIWMRNRNLSIISVPAKFQ